MVRPTTSAASVGRTPAIASAGMATPCGIRLPMQLPHHEEHTDLRTPKGTPGPRCRSSGKRPPEYRVRDESPGDFSESPRIIFATAQACERAPA
jgi:hypothetical protein